MTFKNIFMMQVGIFETNKIGKFLTHIDMYAIIKFKYENLNNACCIIFRKNPIIFNYIYLDS